MFPYEEFKVQIKAKQSPEEVSAPRLYSDYGNKFQEDHLLLNSVFP